MHRLFFLHQVFKVGLKYSHLTLGVITGVKFTPQFDVVLAVHISYSDAIQHIRDVVNPSLSGIPRLRSGVEIEHFVMTFLQNVRTLGSLAV